MHPTPDQDQDKFMTRLRTLEITSDVPTYMHLLAKHRGNLELVRAEADSNHHHRPVLRQICMAAVSGGDSATPGWAQELVYRKNFLGDWYAFASGLTLLGRIPFAPAELHTRFLKEATPATA